MMLKRLLFCLLLPGIYHTELIAQLTTGKIPVNDIWKRPVILPVPCAITGITKPVVTLGGIWKINVAPPSGFWEQNDTASWQTIPVPAQASMFGIRTTAGKEYAYQTRIPIPAEFLGQRMILRFEGVTGLARVYINGKFIKEHFGGFNLWTCDITDDVTAGEDATLVIGITEPLPENASSGFDAGGVIRNVKMMAVPQNYLYRFNVETDFDTQYKNAVLKIWLGTKIRGKEKVSLRLRLQDPKGKNVTLPITSIPVNQATEERLFELVINNPVKWDAEHPELYTLLIDIISDNIISGTYSKKIGFRKVVLQGKNMLINGRPVKLRGAGRFDSDPVYGRYLSDEQCWKEVRMLKDANLNFVRPSCYPPTEAYLDACDALGLYVQSENSVTFTRGAQKDTTLSPAFLSQMADMIETVRSRPSVIIYELANETYYGVNIGLTYRYAKAEDVTRPVIYSWSQSVPEGEPWPYDIYSYHYADWDGDLGTAGVAVFNTKQTRPLPENMPVLHDEFAHGASYYRLSLARNPGMRDFWGHSIKKFWEKMFLTDNCLGGAIWAVVDDNGSNGWVYEWGAIDLWRRERPEYWHIKKAYSPIRIDETQFFSVTPGKAVVIPVKNWYDHTNLDELNVEWSIGSQKGITKGPTIHPHDTGTLLLPLTDYRKGDKIKLRFTDHYQRVVDEFLLVTTAVENSFATAAGDMPGIQYQNGMLAITGKQFEILFDTSTGLIVSGQYNGKTLLTGGPYLNVVGGHLQNWTLKKITPLRGAKSNVVVSIEGAYDSVEVSFDISIDGTGLINTEYTLDQFKLPVPLPHKVPWDNQDAGGFEEVGIYYLLSSHVSRLAWKRKGIWSVYPTHHIGRNEGVAERYTHSPVQQFGKNPDRLWLQDERDFTVFGRYDIGGRGTNDFRSMKENILYATVISDKDQVQLTVEGNKPLAVRLEVIPDTSLYIDNNDASVIYRGSWKPATDVGEYIGNSEVRSNAAGDYIEYTFRGKGIAWLGSAGLTTGMADVWIDGKKEVSDLNFYSRSNMPAYGMVLYSKEGLSDEVHTIRIVAKQGYRQTAGIPFDAFRVWNNLPEGSVKLIINNLWNYTKMGLGNYMKDPVMIGVKYRNSVQFRLQEWK